MKERMVVPNTSPNFFVCFYTYLRSFITSLFLLSYSFNGLFSYDLSLQHYSRGRENLILAPFGVATNVAMMLEGLQGRAAEEITALFRLQSKEVRKQLRRGFKMIFDTFGVRIIYIYIYVQ